MHVHRVRKILSSGTVGTTTGDPEERLDGCEPEAGLADGTQGVFGLERLEGGPGQGGQVGIASAHQEHRVVCASLAENPA